LSLKINNNNNNNNNSNNNNNNNNASRPGRIWEGNIRLYLREIRWEGVDWMHLAQDRISGGLL
jgi:hypothetical protein